LYGRRLQVWIALALAAAVPEALVRSPDQQLAFQAFLVVQLLGVIVAAIAIAAMVSVLGLAVVRVLTWPIANRTSTFVAWSFLRAPRQVLPWPLRLWRAMRDNVDATPPLALDAAAQARFGWQGKRLVVGLLALLCGAGVPWALMAGAADTAAHWPLVVRNLAAATALHGLLLVIAALPGRLVRSALVSVLALVALGAGVLVSRHPVVLPYAEPLALAVGLLVLWLVAALRQPATEVGLAQRLARRGVWLLPAAVAVGVAALVLPAHAPLLAPLAATLLLGGLYLVLQGQSKVSLPVFVSIVGVAAGTWALIVVLSVMGGFAGDLRAKMLVANAHALVESSARGQPFAQAAALAHRLRQLPGVAAASPQVRGDAIVSSAFNVNNFVSLRGIDPDLPEVQRELGATLLTGSLGLLGRPTAMGQDRALTWRRSDLPGDIPATPTDTAAPTESAPGASQGGDAAAQDALEALQALPPGPQDPAPPQPTPRPVYVLPSGLPPQLPPTGRPPSALAQPQPGAGDQTELPDLAAEPAAPVDTLANPLDDPDVQALLGDKGDEPTSVLSDPDIPISPGILLGVELARSLQVGLGDKIEVVTPDGDIGPTGLRPRIRTFRVAGVFETGLYEADSKVAYLALTEAARYFNLAGQANVLELRLTEPKEPDAVMAQIRQTLQELAPVSRTAVPGPAAAGLEVTDWRQLNRSLFSALAFERLVIFLVLGLIILVAAFSIVSALTMVILQKHDSIAMLRAMGATASHIRLAFVQMGAAIGLIGTTAGGLLGVATCTLIERLGIQLPEAYYVRTLPVDMQIAEISAVVVAAIAVSLVATVFPATSAARLAPLEGLRHG
jgi:ABC-type lipoprotein release transport system permease subunit